MTSFVGADPDQLDQLGTNLLSGADWLEETRSRLTAQLYYSTWEGPDAEQIRDEWASSHAPAISAVALVLRDMSLIVFVNANQQREASTADGGSIGRPGEPQPPGTPAPADDGTWFDDLMEYLNIQSIVVSIASVMVSVAEVAWPVLKTAGRVLGVLGLAITGFQLGVSIAQSDTGAIILNGTILVLGGAALIIGAVATAPVWIAVGIGLGVAALAVTIASQFDAVHDWVENTWDSAYEWTSGAVSDVADGISAGWDAAVDFGSTVVDGASDVIEDAGDFASDAIDFGGDVLDSITPW